MGEEKGKGKMCRVKGKERKKSIDFLSKANKTG